MFSCKHTPLLSLIVLALFGVGALSVFAGTAGPVITAAPQVINIIGSGAQVVWTTDDQSEGWVMYGTSPDSYPNYATYRCDGSLDASATSYCINLMNLVPATKYYFMVIAQNSMGSTTASGSFLSAMPEDTTPPSTPTEFIAQVASVTEVRLTWHASTDNVAVAGYKIFRSGTMISGTTNLSYTDTITTAMSGTNVEYSILAVDAARNESASAYATVSIPSSATNTATTTAETTNTTDTTTATTEPTSTADTTVPAAPTTIVATALSPTQIAISWSGATDNVGVVGYKLFRNGSYYFGVTGTGYTDSNVIPDTVYSYAVKAADAAGNESLITTTREVRTPALSTTTLTSTTTTTATSPSEPILVSVTVLRGTSFCEGSIAKTKMTFTANPAGGARFGIVRNGVSTDTIAPGTYDMFNGTYLWEAIANAGFAFDHVARDEFALSHTCIATASPPPPSPLPPPPPAEILPENEPVQRAPSLESTPVMSTKDVATSAQYTSYCENPDHWAECEAYASEKITITESDKETTSVFGSADSEADLIKEEDAQILAMRIGVRMFQDSDSDGITDYDEVNIYHTDPKLADTNGDGVSDGDHLLAGNNPLASSAELQSATGTELFRPQQIVYENPKETGEAKPELLAVTAVTGVTEKTESGTTTTTRLAFSGTALPNGFVTLYIFSDPIVVRVRADDAGVWTYVLDRELSDGSHEVVSAITDTGGRILAKSAPAPFIKVAAAVSFGSSELIPAQSAPSFFSGTYFFLSVALLVILFLIALVVIGGMVRQKSVFREGGGDEMTP